MNDKDHLKIALSTSVFADTSVTDSHFQENGPKLHRDYMLEKFDEALPPNAPGFNLIKTLLNMGNALSHDLVEIIPVTRNSPLTAHRALLTLQSEQASMSSIACVNMDEDIVTPLKIFAPDMFLTVKKQDAINAAAQGITSCLVMGPEDLAVEQTKKGLHLIVDFDKVLMGDEFEELSKNSTSIDDFFEKTKERVNTVISEGPYANVVRTLLKLSDQFADAQIDGRPCFMVSGITARANYATMQAIRQLANMGIDINGHFYAVGSIVKKNGTAEYSMTPKGKVLKALKDKFPNHYPFFLDDSWKNIDEAKQIVACGWVPDTAAPSRS